MGAFVLIIFLVVGRQTPPDSLAIYKVAFDQIVSSQAAREYMRVRDSSTVVVVSDTIVPLEYSTFFDQFSRGVSKKEKKGILDSLLELDAASHFDPYPMQFLHSNLGSREADFTLFFSRRFKNTLLAELCYNPNRFRSCMSAGRFSQTLAFYFEFDDANRIIRMLTTEVQNE
jgi:hypothetical protein